MNKEIAGKAELARAIANNAKCTLQEAQTNIERVCDSIIEIIGQGKEVSLKGFGSFYITETKSRNGVNPRTLEQIVIPASKKVTFKASTTLKDAAKAS